MKNELDDNSVVVAKKKKPTTIILIITAAIIIILIGVLVYVNSQSDKYDNQERPVDKISHSLDTGSYYKNDANNRYFSLNENNSCFYSMYDVKYSCSYTINGNELTINYIYPYGDITSENYIITADNTFIEYTDFRYYLDDDRYFLRENDNQSSSENSDQESTKKIYFYKSKRGTDDSVYATYDEDIYDNIYYEVIDFYKCKSTLCKIFSIYNPEEHVIYDEKYFIYNRNTKTAGDPLNIDKSYDTVRIIRLNDDNIGLILGSKDDDGNEYNDGFYSFATNTITVKNKYSYISYDDDALAKGYIYANNISYDGETSTYYLLDYSTGKVVATGINGSVSNGKYLYYTYNNYNYDDTDYYPSLTFFNTDFKRLLDGKSYNIFMITDDGDIVVSNREANTFSKYDSSGNLLFTSSEYKSIELMTNGYVAVIDKNNYLKLVTTEDLVAATFVKLTDEMYFHYLISGWYEADGKNGIYLVVEDPSSPYVNEEYEPEAIGYEYYYIPSTKEGGKIPTEIGGYAKPILYLYPTKDNTKVNVMFDKPQLLTTTYPKFNDNWNVTANKNGDLYDANSRYYYGLYWEEIGSTKVDFKTGFYVTKNNALKFLEEKLDIIGLNQREANEFIMYWLPILEKNEKSLVYFELTESRQKYNKLIIRPNPDSLLRVAIHVKKVNKYNSIKEENLPTFNRTGFTVVEWGGVQH